MQTSLILMSRQLACKFQISDHWTVVPFSMKSFLTSIASS